MILIRPILQANAKRPRHQSHVVIFFIFLVSNIGGVLTPLGDPPLFFGFLRGVGLLLALAHALAAYAASRRPGAPRLLSARQLSFADKRSGRSRKPFERRRRPHLAIRGLPNVALIAAAVAVILMSAIWHPGIGVDFLGLHLELQNFLRDVSLLAIGFVSLAITPQADRKANHFVWDPFDEVAKLFAAIFITHHSGDGDAGGEFAAGLLRLSLRFWRIRTARRTMSPISGRPACSRPSSTMRRPISSSSALPAAIRRR